MEYFLIADERLNTRSNATLDNPLLELFRTTIIKKNEEINKAIVENYKSIAIETVNLDCILEQIDEHSKILESVKYGFFGLLRKFYPDGVNYEQKIISALESQLNKKSIDIVTKMTSFFNAICTYGSIHKEYYLVVADGKQMSSHCVKNSFSSCDKLSRVTDVDTRVRGIMSLYDDVDLAYNFYKLNAKNAKENLEKRLDKITRSIYTGKLCQYETTMFVNSNIKIGKRRSVPKSHYDTQAKARKVARRLAKRKRFERIIFKR